MFDQRFQALHLVPLGVLPIERRVARLNTLAAAQELYVESRVKRATFLSLQAGDSEYGYLAIDGSQTLLEMHVEDVMIPHIRSIALQLLKTAGVRKILAQSFDPTLMFVGHSIGHKPTTRAMLYRDMVSQNFVPREEITAVEGTTADIEAVSRIGDDFFDSSEEIASYIAENGLLIYSIDDEIVGAGVMKRVIDTQMATDIGMVVAPQRRHQRIGTYIVQHLKNYCISNGLNPICGCEIENVASQRTLEAAGFISIHQLVEFETLP